VRLLTSILYSASMIISTIFTAGIATFLLPLPVKSRFAIIRYFGRYNIWMLKLICGVKYTVEGKENIPDTDAGIIFSRHESTWETMALQQIFPSQTFVIKRELLLVPFFGWGLATIKPISINRKSGRNAINQVVEQGIARLNAGIWVVMFPEGTRMRPGQTVRFKKGGALLAAKSGRPVVPVAHNAGDCWPKGGFLKKPGTIRVIIGPAITTEGRKPEDILSDAEIWITNAMKRIRPETNIPTTPK